MSAGIFFFGNLIFVIFGKGSIQQWNNINKINDAQKSRTCEYSLFPCCMPVDLNSCDTQLTTHLNTEMFIENPKFLDYNATSHRSHFNSDESLELLEVDDQDEED